MPSVVTYDVRSAGANSGTDWNSLKGALSQAQTDYPNLVSSDVQLVFECEAFEDTDSQIDLVSFTTDATRNIIIRAASGAEHGGVSEAGYRLKGSASTQFLIRTSYVTLEGIEIWQSGTANSADCIQVNASLSGTTLRNLIIRTDGSGSGANAFVTSSGCTVENVIATNGAVGFYFAVGESVARNCTSVGCNFGFRSLSAVYVTATNCVAIDSDPTDNFVGDYNAASDYNASEDTSAPGANSVTGISATDGVDFVSPSTGDYTPEASGALDGAGTNLSAFFTDDITGATRTVPWDIGAYAVAGAGPAISISSTDDPVLRGETGVSITGAGFGASQGTGDVTLGGEAVTVTAWSDTSITVTIPAAIALQHGDHEFVVTEDGAGFATSDTLTLSPATGRTFKQITNPSAGVFDEAASVFNGDTELGITGAQYVYDSSTNGAVAITEIADTGYVTFASVPADGDYFDGYKIDSDGTLNAENRYTISSGGGAGPRKTYRSLSLKLGISF